MSFLLVLDEICQFLDTNAPWVTTRRHLLQVSPSLGNFIFTYVSRFNMFPDIRNKVGYSQTSETCTYVQVACQHIIICLSFNASFVIMREQFCHCAEKKLDSVGSQFSQKGLSAGLLSRQFPCLRYYCMVQSLCLSIR